MRQSVPKSPEQHAPYLFRPHLCSHFFFLPNLSAFWNNTETILFCCYFIILWCVLLLQRTYDVREFWMNKIFVRSLFIFLILLKKCKWRWIDTSIASANWFSYTFAPVILCLSMWNDQNKTVEKKVQGSYRCVWILSWQLVAPSQTQNFEALYVILSNCTHFPGNLSEI